jgi:hypothetical protein
MIKFIIFLPLILVGIFAYYYNYLRETREQFADTREFGGALWPKGSYYELTPDGDIIIELNEDFKILNGEWTTGSRFFFSGDEVIHIEAKAPFLFSQIKFESNGIIEKENFPPNVLHKMKLSENIKLDGLDLNPLCDIAFKNHVLYSAKCPEFDTVYFKRFVELPEVINEEVATE